jgi:hypothetical protein
MQENVEISNPMYLREEVDDDADAVDGNFSLDADKVSCFAGRCMKQRIPSVHSGSCMEFLDSRVETSQTQFMTRSIVSAQREVQLQTSVRRRKGCYNEQTKMASTPWETQGIVFSLSENFLGFRKNTKLQCQTLHQIFALSLLHCSSSVPFHVVATQTFSFMFVYVFPYFHCQLHMN